MFDRAEGESLETLSDVALVRLARDGDDDAIGVLLQRHSDQLYRFCQSLVARREDAEDICQEALTRAIARVDSLQSGASFRAWLYAVARNLAVDSFRERKPLSPLLEIEARPSPVLDDTPHEVIEQQEERRDVVSALGRLRRRHQRVLMLREVDRLSYADIAQALEVTESAVETLLFRARRRLREEFNRNDRARALVPAVGGLRALASRLGAPLAGGAAPAAKLALTAAVVAGGVAAIPSLAPQMGRSAHRSPAGPVSTSPAHARRDAARDPGTTAHRAGLVAFRPGSPSVAHLAVPAHRWAKSRAGSAPERAPIFATAQAHRTPAGSTTLPNRHAITVDRAERAPAAATGTAGPIAPFGTTPVVQPTSASAPVRAPRAMTQSSRSHGAADAGRSNTGQSAPARGHVVQAPAPAVTHRGGSRPASPAARKSTRRVAGVLQLQPAIRTERVPPAIDGRVSRRSGQQPPLPHDAVAATPATSRKAPTAVVSPTSAAVPTPTALPAASAAGASQPTPHGGQSRGNGPAAGGPPGQNGAQAVPTPGTTAVVTPATPGTSEGPAGAHVRGHP